MNTKIKNLLEENRVDGFFAYKTLNGFPFPAIFTRENMDELEPWQPTHVRYPILKLLLSQARQEPDKTFGILLRGCEERGLEELFKWNQLDRKKVVVLGQACTRELSEECECHRPYPDVVDYGEAVRPVGESKRIKDMEQMTRETRLSWWLGHMNRCLKCFGCRDVCPVCFCTECSLENQTLVAAEKLPPDTTFHLVRAVHMAGRCVDCGMCELVCPARIPLRSLYKKVNALVEEIFDYTPGGKDIPSPFSFLGEETALPAGPR